MRSVKAFILKCHELMRHAVECLSLPFLFLPRTLSAFSIVSSCQDIAFQRLRKINGRFRTVRMRQIVCGGQMWVNNYETTNAFIWWFGAWEPAISDFLISRVSPNDKFVDIGANIGYYSVLAHSLGAKPIAFEPLPSVRSQLERNFRTNGIDTEAIKSVAIGDHPYTTKLHEGPILNRGKSSICGQIQTQLCAQRTFEVFVKPLEYFLDEIEGAKFIKIDVEGVELEVLENVIKNIDKFDAAVNILVEVRVVGMNEKEVGRVKTIFVRLKQLGFSFTAVENGYEFSFYARASGGDYRTWKYESIRQLMEAVNRSGMLDLVLTREKPQLSE